MKKLFFFVLWLIPTLAFADPFSGPFGPVPPSDDAYDATAWDGDEQAATKNAIRDQIESMITSPTFSGDLLPDSDNTYDIGENSTPLRFQDIFLSGTANAPIFTGGEAATQSGSFTVHHGGIVTWWDAGNNTSVVFGPVTNDTTTIGITGSISVSGDVAGGSLTLTPTDDPAVHYDPATAGESEWWTGVNHDAGGDDNDPFEIRQSTTPGTNVRWQVDTDGVETSYGWNVTDGTDTTTFAMKTESGESNANLVIGVDKERGGIIICEDEDVNSDFNLPDVGVPFIALINEDNSYNLSLYQSGTTASIQGSRDVDFISNRYMDFVLSSDNAGIYAFIFETSSENNELTDADGEQSFLYVEPRINQSSTAGYNGLKIEVIEENLGDASSATDSLTNNLILAGTSVDPDMFKVDNSGRLKAGDVQTALHTITVTLTAAEVNALRATPQTIVAAQGANTWIELVSAVITYDYATAAFTVAGDEDLVIEWADGTDATASIETTGFLDQTDDEMRFYPAVLAAGADPEASINQALQVFNSGTGETADGGTSEVDIQVVYRVYATGF